MCNLTIMCVYVWGKKVCFGWCEHRWKCVLLSSVYTCELSPTLTCVRAFFFFFPLHDSSICIWDRDRKWERFTLAWEWTQSILFVRLWLPSSPLGMGGRKGRKLGKESEKNEFIAKKSCPSSEGMAANWVTGCTPSPTPGRNSFSRHTLQHLRVLTNTRWENDKNREGRCDKRDTMLEGGGEVSGNWSREVRRRRGNVCKEGASPAKHYDVISTVLLRIFWNWYLLLMPCQSCVTNTAFNSFCCWHHSFSAVGSVSLSVSPPLWPRLKSHNSC